MSITYIGEDPETPRNLKEDKNGVITSQRGFLFTTDSIATEFEIRADPSCPAIGAVHPAFSGAWCIGLDIVMRQPKYGWLAVASYSSEREYNEDPELDPVRLTWDTENYQEVAVIDKNDDLVVNSAGDPFDPPVMKDFSRRSVIARKNVSSVPSWFLDYEDAVNSDSFVIGGLTIPIGVAKCKKTIIGEVQTRNGIDFYEVTTVIHFSKRGWKKRELDAGFRRIYSGTKRELITMENAAGETEYPVAPVPLDGTGVELVDPTPSTAVFLEFDLDDDLPFSVLPIS